MPNSRNAARFFSVTLDENEIKFAGVLLHFFTAFHSQSFGYARCTINESASGKQRRQPPMLHMKLPPDSCNISGLSWAYCKAPMKGRPLPKKSMEQKKTSLPLSQSEAFPLIEEYFCSGVKGAEFYRSKNMTEKQFYKWKQRFLDAHPEKRVPDNLPAKKPPLFQPVTVVGKPSRLAPQIEIVYPGGVTLRVGEGTVDIRLLRELVNL